VPPRCSKTSLVNVAWPAWIWAQPEDRLGPLSGPISHDRPPARHGALVPASLGEAGHPLDDQASKENFATTAGGFRLATSMSGATLGRGGDIKILDDPNSVQQAAAFQPVRTARRSASN
jgi:hypothetical protein